MTYYAVACGRVPGIYESWSDTKKNIDGFAGAKFRKFATREDAISFVSQYSTKDLSSCEYGERKETETLLLAFCDGACSNNGRRGAIGGYASVWPYHSEYDGGWHLQEQVTPTNNRAEFMGLIKTMEIANIIDPTGRKELLIFTDSKFLIQCITEWMFKWKKNGFKKVDGHDVLNQDLLKTIDEYLKIRKVTLQHVKAHTGKKDWISIYNDKADKLAKDALH